MPPKRKIRPAKKPKNKNQNQIQSKNTSSRELAEVTRLLRNLSTPKNQVTDLGRMLLSGGNTVSSMFGFPKIFGSGEYSMQNSCWNAQQQVPIMHSANEAVVLRHREYIADVSVNGPAFNLTTYNINPGLFQSFPYLSAVASCFQQYRFKGLVFEYKTTSATALVSGTNTAMGSVMLAVQYRSDAAPFTNKTQLLNEMWSVDTVPSSNVVLPVECAPAETVLTHQYIRTGGIGTGDVKMFDLGVLSVATFGAQTGQTNVIGELWVSYEVELLKPQLSVAESGSLFFASTSTTFTSSSPTGGFSAGAYAGNTLQGITITGNTINFSTLNGPGFYQIQITWAGSNTTTTAPSVTASGGLSVPSAVTPYNSVIFTPNGSATAQFFMDVFVFCNTLGGTLTFGSSGTIPTTGQSYLLIQPVSSSLPFV
jgi:hypothetical protein